MPMRFTLTKRFNLEMAHSLEGYVPDDHKCARLHGHTYTVVVRISGTALDENGMLIDFAKLKKPIHDLFDHQNANEVLHFIVKEKVPSTAEKLADVFYRILDEGPIREANAGQEPAVWIRIDELAVQEGDGGIASMVLEP